MLKSKTLDILEFINCNCRKSVPPSAVLPINTIIIQSIDDSIRTYPNHLG